PCGVNVICSLPLERAIPPATGCPADSTWNDVVTLIGSSGLLKVRTTKAFVGTAVAPLAGLTPSTRGDVVSGANAVVKLKLVPLPLSPLPEESWVVEDTVTWNWCSTARACCGTKVAMV